MVYESVGLHKCIRCQMPKCNVQTGQRLADVGRAVSEAEADGNLLCNASGRTESRKNEKGQRKTVNILVLFFCLFRGP